MTIPTTGSSQSIQLKCFDHEKQFDDELIMLVVVCSQDRSTESNLRWDASGREHKLKGKYYSVADLLFSIF